MSKIGFWESFACREVLHVQFMREVNETAHFGLGGVPFIRFLFESLQVYDENFWSFVYYHLLHGFFVLLTLGTVPFVTLLQHLSFFELSKALIQRILFIINIVLVDFAFISIIIIVEFLQVFHICREDSHFKLDSILG